MRAKQIAKLIAGGAFRANEAKVWKEGMEDWRTIKDSKVLAEASLQPEIEPAESGVSPSESGSIPGAAPLQDQNASGKTEDSPYSAPRSPLELSQSQEIDYGGIGRFGFIFGPLLLVVGFHAIMIWVYGIEIYDENSENDPVPGVGAIALLVALMISLLWINLARFKNLGMSGWWILGTIVPILNIWLQWRQAACPEGYADHQRLDTIGKVLTFIFVIIPLGLVALFAVVIATGWVPMTEQ